MQSPGLCSYPGGKHQCHARSVSTANKELHSPFKLAEAVSYGLVHTALYPLCGASGCRAAAGNPQLGNLRHDRAPVTINLILWDLQPLVTPPPHRPFCSERSATSDCGRRQALMSATSCPGEREELLSQPLKPAPAVPFSSPYHLFRREQQPLQPPGLSKQDREKRLGELTP